LGFGEISDFFRFFGIFICWEGVFGVKLGFFDEKYPEKRSLIKRIKGTQRIACHGRKNLI